ncbi:hypothetical protein ABIB40_003164 [Pedobacter sp. UYP30]|uniref:hypothetical protein n=1 Tax=Pedobacter sp. UYP30 TaxID=1756400 RepID=UPI0033957858
MIADYSTLQFSLKGKIFKGFCVKIQDDFHETYAVVLDGYHSFCIWLDDRNTKWCASRNAMIDAEALDEIIIKISGAKSAT